MILDGKTLSSKILQNVRDKVANMTVNPHLVVIFVGNNPASKLYVKNKQKAAEFVGIKSTVIELSENISENELIKKIEELNNDNNVTGILVQMPLPSHINKNNIVQTISPKKDVDGFHPENVGKMARDFDAFG